VFRGARARVEGARRAVLCRPWILCNETAISNGVRAECRWIKYPMPLRKKARDGRENGTRNGRQTYFDFPILGYTIDTPGWGPCDRAGSRGCIKVSLIFPVDRCGNLLRARSFRSRRTVCRCFFVYWNATSILLSPGFLTHPASLRVFIRSREKSEFFTSRSHTIIAWTFWRIDLNRSGSGHVMRYSCRFSYETRFISWHHFIDLVTNYFIASYNYFRVNGTRQL